MLNYDVWINGLERGPHHRGSQGLSRMSGLPQDTKVSNSMFFAIFFLIVKLLRFCKCSVLRLNQPLYHPGIPCLKLIGPLISCHLCKLMNNNIYRSKGKGVWIILFRRPILFATNQSAFFWVSLPFLPVFFKN
jgi:hypothetical protein